MEINNENCDLLLLNYGGRRFPKLLYLFEFKINTKYTQEFHKELLM